VRGRLLAVAQDAFTLPGTVAQNLDPSGVASAAAAEAALRRVGLWPAVSARGGLDAALDADALSHGQRQLFALARALLRAAPARVVLLDEAAAAVDADTAVRIREVLAEAFAGYTVLAVAHRLEALADFDRVVVLEGGCVVEDGKPAELLAGKGNGRFKALWEASRRGLVEPEGGASHTAGGGQGSSGGA